MRVISCPPAPATSQYCTLVRSALEPNLLCSALLCSVLFPFCMDHWPGGLFTAGGAGCCKRDELRCTSRLRSAKSCLFVAEPLGCHHRGPVSVFLCFQHGSRHNDRPRRLRSIATGSCSHSPRPSTLFYASGLVRCCCFPDATYPR